MSKKKVFVIIGTVVVAAAAAAALWYYSGRALKDSNDRVYVEKVSKIMGTATGNQNRYSGIVEPQKTVEVNADSERTIKEIFVNIGDTVEEGTPLFNYDTDELGMDIEQTRLEIENIDSEIKNYRNQIAELEAERNAAAEGDKFEYTTQIQTIQTTIKQSEFDKEGKKLELEKTQKKIDNSEVASTIAGVVKTLNDPKTSDNMNNESSAFMTILATGDFRVKGTLNEQNISMVTVGSQVIVRSRVDENQTWTGTVGSVDMGDPSGSGESDGGGMAMDMGEGSANQSTSYPFYVAMENAEGLMLGQHVLIELDQGQAEVKEGVWLYSNYIVQDDGENAVSESLTNTEAVMDIEAAMDLEAVMDTEALGDTETVETKSAYVWADNGENRLEKRAVELGEYDPELDEYKIISGLSEDDMIAWPMPGLYEGIITVTDMEEVDYNSGLYTNNTEMMNTEGFYEEGSFGTEMMMEGIQGVDGGMGLDSTETWDEEQMLQQNVEGGTLDMEVSE